MLPYKSASWQNVFLFDLKKFLALLCLIAISVKYQLRVSSLYALSHMIIRKSSSFIPGFKRGLHNNFRLLKASLSYGCHNPKMVLLIPFMLSLVDRAVLRYAISQKKIVPTTRSQRNGTVACFFLNLLTFSKSKTFRRYHKIIRRAMTIFLESSWNRFNKERLWM